MDENGKLTSAGAANVCRWLWDQHDLCVQPSYIVGRTPQAVVDWYYVSTAAQIEEVAKTGTCSS